MSDDRHILEYASPPSRTFTVAGTTGIAKATVACVFAALIGCLLVWFGSNVIKYDYAPPEDLWQIHVIGWACCSAGVVALGLPVWWLVKAARRARRLR